jgi:hypothetical protein
VARSSSPATHPVRVDHGERHAEGAGHLLHQAGAVGGRYRRGQDRGEVELGVGDVLIAGVDEGEPGCAVADEPAAGVAVAVARSGREGGFVAGGAVGPVSAVPAVVMSAVHAAPSSS